MSWIKEFSKSTYKVWAGNSFDAYQPIDFYHFYPLWYDFWIADVAKAIRILGLENKAYSEIKDLLPVPSSILAILFKMVAAYKGANSANTGDYKLVANFLARALTEARPNDPFASVSNPVHTQDELANLIKNLNWQTPDRGAARQIGRLITSAGSLVHGLYNDLVTDSGWDTYGPYEVSYDQDAHTSMIRHFPNLSPNELWPKHLLPSCREIKIYALYQDVEWEISVVGCHTISKNGNPVDGLKKYAVTVDGKPIAADKIAEMIEELSDKATQIYQDIRQTSLSDLKQKALLQECYQLKLLMNAAGMRWKPTKKMSSQAAKPILTGIFPMGKLITSQKDFENIIGLKTFSRQVLEEG